MKKIVLLSLLSCFAILSCKKTDMKHVSNFESTAVLSEETAKGTNYLLYFQTGHKASECRGCVTMNGVSFHVECMGPGNECLNSSLVSLIQNSGNDYTATTLDSTALTSEAFFNMPDRSLFVGYDDKNNEMWLNIPAQLVFRDSTTQQFTFTGLYYSNAQVYENE